MISRERIWRRCKCLGGGIVCFALGALSAGMHGELMLVTPARADITEGEQPKAFLAGGERSEIVLREIQAMMKEEIVTTLKRMDVRLSHIEAGPFKTPSHETRPTRQRAGQVVHPAQ